MLSTVLYRSHLCDHVPVKTLEDMVDKANKKNELSDVTGILLFDGLHFFQLLEGPHEAVQSIYERICKDARHENLVELLHDYAPARRFGNSGMELFDLREHDKATVLQAVLNKGTSKYQLTFEDRALRFLRTFVEAREKENYFEIPPASTWEFIADSGEKVASAPSLLAQADALEALIRSADGGPPQKFFAPYSRKQAYEIDLKSKSQAFKLAKQFGIPELTLSINLLPMSLVMVPNAVDYLLAEIRASGLVPEQIVVEVTEDEAISRADEFAAAIKQLKAAGISVALDDFGAGFAGLSLLAKFQPDKIKIDRNIIKDVHKSGPKQAIVHAIIKCCSSLEISVIAEGVEKAEEWMWLEAAGISKFQGFLFARPQLNGIPALAWPEIQ